MMRGAIPGGVAREVGVGLAVLGVGLALSGLVSMEYASQNAERVQGELARQSHLVAETVADRVRGYERGLRGIRGAVLVGGREHMTTEALRVYAESREFARDYPGAEHFGFVQRDGTGYAFKLVLPPLGDLTPLTSTEVTDGPKHRAFDAAMRSGHAAMAPLWPTGGAPRGYRVLVVLPVYRPGAPVTSEAERAAAALGWSFVALDLDRTLADIDVGDDVAIDIRDGASAAGSAIYTLGALRTPARLRAPAEAFELYGGHWLIAARAGHAFVGRLTPVSPLWIDGTGLVVSLLAASLAGVWTAAARRRQELDAQRDLLSNVVANASDAIITESMTGVVLSWNAAAEQLFGYPAHEAVGRNLAELLHDPDAVHEHAELLQSVASGTRVAPFDAVRQRRDGAVLDVAITAVPVTGPGGRIVAVAKTVRDVSARKAEERLLSQGLQNLELEIERRGEKLGAVERVLHSITDAMPSMIGYWDQGLVNRFANRAYERWFGVDRRKMTGMHMRDLLGDELFESNRAEIDAALRGDPVTFERELPGIEDAPPAHVLVHYIPDVHHGEVRGFYVMVHDVTALKVAQQGAAASEIFLEQAGAVSGVGGFRIDLRSGEQTWTRQTFRIYELDTDVAPSAEELDKLMAPDVGAKLWKAIRVAAETGVGYDIEIPVTTARGKPIWIRTIGVVEFDDGKPTRVVGAVQDTTDRKQSEEALRVASERLALAADAAGIGVWEYDIINDLDLWDDQMYRLYGREPALGGDAYAIWTGSLHPEDRARVLQELEDAQRPEGKFDTEYRICLSNGAVRHIKSVAQVRRGAAGVALRMVGVNFDITERKAAEQALKDSESKFRSLFELAPVGIALTELPGGRFLHVNEALAEPTGYTRDELLHMTYFDITPAAHAETDAAQARILQSNSHYGPYEKEYRRKDGSTYAVQLSGISTQDEANRAVLWSFVQDISARKAMESQLVDAASRDKLTGLANRALFLERLESALGRVRTGVQRHFAVLFLDFDRFKLINDTLGHDIGDELLRQIAQRLRRQLRASDVVNADDGANVVSRFGGDEFLVLVNDLTDPNDASRIAERLLNALSPVYNLHGNDVNSSASIGIVTSDQCNTSAEEVIRNADVAMYEAKRAGRACCVVFNEAMQTQLTRHVTIENSLRRAIGTDELYLVYQPIVELATGRMVSAEALIRWNHPVLGVIPPSEFIPIAEESNLIIALGEWVQARACQAMAGWLAADPERAPRTISVNVSRAELALGQRLLDQVRATLVHSGLEPKCLQLEITEREVMRHPEAAQVLLQDLRKMGVQIAMDDFGTGTSSLGLLRHYPFHTVKIDRTFVEDLSTPDVLAVIHATINLVENLGMASLAEGVEGPDQVAVLQALGCRYAQGYYFSRPVAAERLLDALTANATPA